jgi:hypothetical protein
MWPSHALQQIFWRGEFAAGVAMTTVSLDVGAYVLTGQALVFDTPLTLQMQIEEAVYQILKTDARVRALVGGRIFSGKFPQTLTYPAICYRAPVDNRRRHVRALDGSLALITDWIDVLSASKLNYGEAARLDEVMALALQDYRGTVTDPLDGTKHIDIQRIVPSELAHNFINDERTEVKQFITRFDCTYLQSLV